MKVFNVLANAITSKWGAKGILAVWITVVIILTLVAPPAKDHTTSVPVSGLPDTAQSVVGSHLESEFFDGHEGAPALFVYKKEGSFERSELDNVGRFTEQVQDLGWSEVEAILPFEHVPEEVSVIGYFNIY